MSMERYLCDTCLYANNCQFIAKHKEGAIGCSAYINTFGVSIDRLREICAAERDGRLVVLPCKVGDTVCKHWKVGGKTEIGSALVTGFEIANDGINYCYRVKRFDRKETIKKFGKTVFLTRAEAEEALKEAQHERD
jgi:hypothetical protein